jgi:hypothetical protein
MRSIIWVPVIALWSSVCGAAPLTADGLAKLGAPASVLAVSPLVTAKGPRRSKPTCPALRSFSHYVDGWGRIVLRLCGLAGGALRRGLRSCSHF